jgi:hypothetical protein
MAGTIAAAVVVVLEEEAAADHETLFCREPFESFPLQLGSGWRPCGDVHTASG